MQENISNGPGIQDAFLALLNENQHAVVIINSLLHGETL